MNVIQIFNNPTFGEVRTTLSAGNEPLFCLADVCKALGLRQGDVNQRLDDGVVSTQPIIDSLGRTQQANFVNEDGLYDVILDSRKPEAKQFRKWVTSEVLPTIRKTGGYISTKEDDTPEMIMARAILVAQKTIEEKNKQLEQANNQIKADAPKVLFANCITESKSSCLIGELAKILTANGYTIGQNRLFQKLRDEHYLGTRGEFYNIPNQQYVEQGLFQILKRPHFENGVSVVSSTIKVTGKGQQYFINKFISRS